MCLSILGFLWLLAGIVVTVKGARGKSIDIGWKKKQYCERQQRCRVWYRVYDHRDDLFLSGIPRRRIGRSCVIFRIIKSIEEYLRE